MSYDVNCVNEVFINFKITMMFCKTMEIVIQKI